MSNEQNYKDNVSEIISSEGLEGVELRSEELQEILGDVPHWILRWGIIIISTIVFILFIGSWFFKYPDTIEASMTLTSATPPASLVAKTSGRLKELYVNDKSQVQADEYLAVIDNPASTEAILTLKSKLQELLQKPDDIISFQINRDLQLGNVQGGYASFIRSLHNYKNFIELNYFPQKIAASQERLNSHRQYYSRVKRQQEITERQHQIIGDQFQRDSLLMQKEFISQQDLETTQTQYLQSSIALENSYISLENYRMRISELQETILDFQQQYLDQKSNLESELNTNITSLINEINTWEMVHVLIAPFAGQITFTNYWTENQNISAGESVFNVIPEKEDKLIGKALLPVARSGKVKKGQRVNIFLVNYPDEEFGIVRGVIENISLVPVDNHYTLEIALPDGLLTTYKKTLPFSQEMAANIEIITENLRLLERTFMPIKKMIYKNT